MWKKYLVLFLSKDWYTMYEGHAIVKARNEDEALKKACKQTGNTIDRFADSKYAWFEIELV